MSIDTAREGAASVASTLTPRITRHIPHFAAQVVSTSQARKGVQQDDYIFPLLNLLFRIFQRLIDDTSMSRQLLG